MKTENRPLNSHESSRLSKCIEQLELAATSKLNWTAISLLALLEALSWVHIYHYDASDWSLMSKFLAVFCPIVIWVIIENKYKKGREKTKVLHKLKEIEANKIIPVIPIHANRIIEFIEKEDEGTLYLIEQVNGPCIYLWNEQDPIPGYKSFPCNIFDIYVDNNFIYAIEERIHCKGERIEPIKISGKSKWAYFDERGFPGDVQIEPKKFDEVIEELKTIA